MLPHHGMRYGGKERYDSVTPGVHMRSIKYVDPTPGTNVNTDKVISFRLALSEVEWGRLLNAPFLIKFSAKYTNPDYVENDADAEKKTKEHYLRPSADKPAVILPDALGANCLFEKVDVFLNGIDIQEHSRMGSFQFIYQSLNRYFSTKDQRDRLGQEYVIDRSLDVDLSKKTPDLTRAMTLLDAQTYNSGGSHIFAFGFDGVPFLSGSRCLALSSLQGHDFIDNVTLPPSSVLDIHLQKRLPLYAGFHNLGISNGSYFSSDPATNDLTEIDITIEEIRIGYESLVPRSGSSLQSQLKASKMRMFFDVPYITYQAVYAGLERPSHTVLVPPGAKVMYAVIMFGHQLWYSKADKKYIAGKFRFPPNLTTALFHLAGHETVGQSRGFVNFGGGSGYISPSAKAYHFELAERKILDCAFYDMFPPGEGQISFRQAFFLDLRGYRIKEPTQMTIELGFSSRNNTLSPAKSYIVAAFVREIDLGKQHKETVLNVVK